METLLTDTGLGTFAQVNFPNLRELDLSDNRFKDDSLPSLSKFPRLNTLRIAGNKVTELGAKHFSSLRELETLDIGCTPLGNAGVQVLSQAIPHVRHLDVRSCDFDDTVLDCFLRFLNLETLNISKNRIGTPALQQFLATEQGKKIKVTAENLRQ